jgi:hypothetical protein
MGAEHTGEMLAALDNSEWSQALQSCASKRVAIKGRVNQRKVMHQTFDGLAAEQAGERTAFLN